MRTPARFHNLALPLAVATLLLGGALALPQDPPKPPAEGGEAGQEPEAPQKPTYPLASDARNQKLKKDLLGAWQILQADHQGTTGTQGSATGYMVIAEGYLSIEVHLRLPSPLPGGSGLYFQTGTHRWRLDGAGRMETSSLVGTTNFTPDEQVYFQPPGEQRLWEVWLDGTQLTLERRGQSRLVLRKLGFLPFPGEDSEFGFKKKPVAPEKDKPKRP